MAHFEDTGQGWTGQGPLAGVDKQAALLGCVTVKVTCESWQEPLSAVDISDASSPWHISDFCFALGHTSYHPGSYLGRPDSDR